MALGFRKQEPPLNLYPRSAILIPGFQNRYPSRSVLIKIKDHSSQKNVCPRIRMLEAPLPRRFSFSILGLVRRSFQEKGWGGFEVRMRMGCPKVCPQKWPSFFYIPFFIELISKRSMIHLFGFSWHPQYDRKREFFFRVFYIQPILMYFFYERSPISLDGISLR